MASTGEIVAVVGDWHGNANWATGRLMSLGKRGVKTVLHAGDFGIWPGSSGKKYLLGLEKVCARFGSTLYITAGNHEDWPRLLAERPEQRDEFGPLLWLSEHIAVFPRDPAGHRFEIGDRTFVSLGGAPSIDFEDRSLGSDWWLEEMIPRETAERVAAGGVRRRDAHPRRPEPSLAGAACRTDLRHHPLGWSREALSYAAVGRNRLTTAFLGVQPRLLVHGHYHVGDEAIIDLPDRDHDCRILSLGCDEMDDNIALLDLRTLERA